MSTFTIGNASNIPLNTQSGSIPNMGTALLDWFQYITFGQITKTTVGFQVSEALMNINFWGIVQPLSGRQLNMKPEGQRKWAWSEIYAQSAPAGAIVSLNVDDVITYQTKQFRIMTRREYALYGYVYFEMVEDYVFSGPPTP